MRPLSILAACVLAIAGCSGSGESEQNNDEGGGLGVGLPTTGLGQGQMPNGQQTMPNPIGMPNDTNGASGTGVVIAGNGASPPMSTGGTTAAPPLAGTDAPPVAGAAGAPPVAGAGVAGTGGAGTGAEPPPEPGCVLAIDECDIDSGFPGDQNCILPPPPGEGFQVHIGPDNYNSPGQFLMQDNDEVNNYYNAVSGNTESVHYYYRQYRMRPGSHHLIVSAAGGGGGGGIADAGGRLGGTQNSVKDNPDCGIIAPENEGVGMPLGARTSLSVNIHAYNFTGAPSIHEAWINFWYRDPAVVKEEAREMFSMGGLGMAIAPGAHETLGPYSCPITSPGRVLSMYGHVHANTVRFSAWRVRGGQRELVNDAYDWEHPPVYEYNSITENPAPMPGSGMNGATSGVLDLQPGDALEWECEVENQQNVTLRFANEVYTGEMCIMIGDNVGPSVSCQHF